MSQPPDDLLNIFWIEANEYLEALNRIMLQVEVASPDDDQTETLREISRIAHSLKGAARAVGQDVIEKLSHRMEDIFDLALDGHTKLDPMICDAVYDTLDVIQMYAGGGEAAEETIEVVLEQLNSIIKRAADAIPAESAAPPKPVVPNIAPEEGTAPPVPSSLVVSTPSSPEPSQDRPSPLATLNVTTAMRPAEDTVRVSLNKVDQLMGQTSELLIARMHSEQRRQDLQALMQEHRRWQRAWRQTRGNFIRITRRLKDKGEELPYDDQDEGGGRADWLGLLDFMESTQQYMTHSTRKFSELNRLLAQDQVHLNTLIDELQSDIATVRMLPFEMVVSGFQRMVRDLARDVGKDVNLVIVGADVELDKRVLEMLKDPLMHILRNSVDHGIESPEKRLEQGKSENGTITLSITSRGNDIDVAVADDGGGIDAEKVRQRALKAGLIGEGDLNAYAADEITALIFEPGFSTAAEVTAVSGRGVGLDIVRQRVEALRGRLMVDNNPGEGTTFHLIVPVSLTRMRCLLARIGQEQYAIPVTTVTRMINVDPADVFTVEDRPMIEFDGRPMPLVHLAEILESEAPPSALTPNSPVLILHSTEQRLVAFIIDELISEQELVLKKLGDELGRVRNVAGAAILGTGDVIIVLHSSDLIKSARRARGLLAASTEHAVEDDIIEERPRWVLVVDDSLTTRTLEKNILEAAGFRVRTATDGTEAVKVLMEQPFDVIVADVEMPKMNGFELAQRVKNDGRFKDIPFILVTSLDSPADRERGLRAGANAYLVKTRFDQDELLETIKQMV